MAQGILYGIGLGPGDPELMTLKAHRLIGACPVVAYPARPGGPSMARAIAAGSIAPGVEEIRIDVPMTPERAPAQAAYDAGAERVAVALGAGRDVALLCEGDPLLYGSFMYLHARLAPRFHCEVVPGVSSVAACAALAGRPVAARNEVFTVLPAPLPGPALRAAVAAADSLAILKIGRHLARVRDLLTQMGLAERAVYVERAGHPDGRALPLSEAPEAAPYFSMILLRKGGDPWLG
ncbi:precorrin-2 C(20)-methyltransferase [Paroceanicella profunda]|uniref:Precorrin-2 C(20)-methyltransferase n=1 Tax=Paroceanicella profunda TaxID=2579971 RepID=A0A5B8FIG1_9RHOB|nr:precorrin-2 C(20)-methyltransferase [Paroceanicella profunda]QDL93038.1 precorrin-2 C(20)-methyltransferase [Paroceanicella profunda]